MNLEIKDQLFIVGGATSGFGRAVSEVLIQEGARVIAVARGRERLKELRMEHGRQIEAIGGDITQSSTLSTIKAIVQERPLAGIFVNAGGPPAGSFQETRLEDWDQAYHNLLRWKLELTQLFLPKMIQQQYGRLVFLESVSVKQPIENLILSNSLRLAVVGFVKTLSQEIAEHGVTANVLAPGYHATPAIDRLLKKKSETEKIPVDAAREAFEAQTLVGKMGRPEDLAALAVWLLAPVSGYITGQTISVDGGVVKGTLG